MVVDETKPSRVTLRGGYESRLALSLVALVFLAGAFAMTLDTGQAGLAGTLVFAVPIAAFSLGMLWLILRSSVVVTDGEILVRHFADPRTQRIPRAGVVGVELVEAGSLAMSALAPRLRVSAASGQSRDLADTELAPLVVWTWWRPGTPRRATHLVERLNHALDLSE